MRLVTMASIMALLAAPAAAAAADRQVERIVTRHVRSIVPADGGGGVAVALRIEGRTLFFNYGWADRANKRPITTDTLFNLASLRKVFETTLLAQAVGNGELKLDDPVTEYVAELDRDGDIGRVTLGQLATHTSGLLLPQDHPPWPDWGYTLPEFIRTLNAWKADKAPGQQHLYTHAGYVLLQLALERRYGVPIDELIEQRLLRPLGMTSTTLPRQDDSTRGRMSSEHKRRAVQGYSERGEPLGEPGSQESYYHWPGTGQMYSSACDMAVFLAANLGELSLERSLREAMNLAHQSVWTIGPRNRQALAWEVLGADAPTITEKYGGLHNASAYIGMMLRRKLGIVILGNRAKQYPNEVGRRILLELATSRRLRASHAGGRVRRPNQAGGGGPSYSRTRSLRTVSSSTSSAWKRAFLTVMRPSASRPIASAPTAMAPNAAAPIASAIMLVAGMASARRTISRGIDGSPSGTGFSSPAG
jgi:beta-lactamase class C